MEELGAKLACSQCRTGFVASTISAMYCFEDDWLGPWDMVGAEIVSFCGTSRPMVMVVLDVPGLLIC